MPTFYSGKLLPQAIAGFIAVSSSLYVGEAKAEQPTAPDDAGTITYSRDVYYRSAIGPSVPGEAHRVDISPDDIVVGMLAQGLKPLSDSEAAGLTAPIGSVGASVRGAMQGTSAALALSHAERGSDLGQLSGSSQSGGIVGQAMSVLPSALGSMRAALGGGQ